MTWLITTDIHLSDRPKDAYRFKLFNWLAKKQIEHKVTATFILGDITENKDKHQSTLVNRTIDGFRMLKPPVYILRGNHDGNDPDWPFFRFMNGIEGLKFVIKPTKFNLLEGPVAMIPHCRTQALFDEACQIIPAKAAGVMLHNTFEGALAETGARLAGLRASPAAFNDAAGVWCGDVHRPQQQGAVTYVGSPYHVRFGDRFTPRVLLVSGTPDEVADRALHFPAPRKWALKINDAITIASMAEEQKLLPGDQVRLEVQLAREEVVEYTEIKRHILKACAKAEVEVYGVNMKVIGSSKQGNAEISERTLLDKADVFEAFCKKEKIPSAQREAGRAILADK